jgi:hypothetical protein
LADQQSRVPFQSANHLGIAPIAYRIAETKNSGSRNENRKLGTFQNIIIQGRETNGRATTRESTERAKLY